MWFITIKDKYGSTYVWQRHAVTGLFLQDGSTTFALSVEGNRFLLEFDSPKAAKAEFDRVLSIIDHTGKTFLDED